MELQQQINLNSQVFCNSEFKQLLFNRLVDNASTKKLGKFRCLNKLYNQKICENIDTANVQLKNLEGLAKSELATKIVNLKVSIPASLGEINKLRFASINYFKNIQAVNVSLVGTMLVEENNQRRLPQSILHIPESIEIYGMNFINKSNIESLIIQNQDINANIDIKISNSKFNGIRIATMHITNVEISNCSFLNARSNYYGFGCCECNSLIMDKITVIQNSSSGVAIRNVQNVFINNIQIYCTILRFGIRMHQVVRFEINNALIQNCRFGIQFYDCKGELKNSVIKECKGNGVQLNRSRVYYSNIQCSNNEQGNQRVDEESVFDRLN